VTSVAGVGAEVSAFAIYAGWALGEVVPVAAYGLVVAAMLPLMLRVRPAAKQASSEDVMRSG
jgi:hypothetical protein